MPKPFQIDGKLISPPDQGAQAVPVSFGASLQADSENHEVLTLLGSGTHGVGLGTVDAAGLKGFLIKVDSGSPTPGGTVAPIFIRYNSGTNVGQLEIPAGGGIAYWAPSPVAGVTALTLVYTSDVRVRLWTYS